MLLSPHIVPLFVVCFHKAKGFWDRRFTCDTTQTRQTIQSEYENIYIGPEFLLENRLGQVLAIFWMTFFIMPAIPTVCMVNVLSLFFMYWIDKFLLLRFYRSPKSINDELISNFVHKFKWALFVHAILGTFMLSNQNILSSDTYIHTNVIEESNKLVETWTGGNIVIAERYK